MVFVFAVDITQLSCSIRTVYGQDMDSTGYLCRFFDYISKIPKQDNIKIIKRHINNMKWINQHENKDKYATKMDIFFTDIQAYYNLTLRDLDTILKSYSIMCDEFLDKYYIIAAHYIYIFFMTMKFKQLEVYNAIFDKQSKEDCLKENAVVNTKLKEYKEISNVLNMRNNIIADLKLNRVGDVNYIYTNFEILEVKNDKIYFRCNQGNHNFNVDKETCLSSLLFEPDLRRYESIKGLKYGDYIYQKLEMFNFVSMEI